MKKGVHPKRYNIKVTCTDGSHFLTKSTTPKSEIKLEMDTKTHPAWTKKELAQDSLQNRSLRVYRTKYKELPSYQSLISKQEAVPKLVLTCTQAEAKPNKNL